MAAPAIAVLMASGAGIAGSAEPLDRVRNTGILRAPAATIRIVLPPPTRMAAPEPRLATGTVRFMLPEPRAERPRPAVPVAPPPTPKPEPAAALVAVASVDLPVGRVTPAIPQPIAPIASSASPEPEPVAIARVREVEPFAPSPVAQPIAPEPVQSLAPMRPTEAAPPRTEGIGKYQRTLAGLAFSVPAKVNGSAVGPVSLLIRDGSNIAISLADLLKVIEPAVEPAVFDKLSASQAARRYVTLNELRAAGIPVRFDDADRLIIGKR